MNMSEELEEKLINKYLDKIKRLRLIDDIFMSICFENNIEATELVLRIILNKPDIHVKQVKTQRVMKNLLGREIKLDIDATDDTGKEYNIEIQRADKGADRKRARYHSSILDSNLLKAGEDFSKLPETYVIFITEHDVIGKNEPLYIIERQIINIDEPFNDGEHIIYVNGAGRNGATELGKLMQDFFCANPDDMHFKPLADKTRYFKENKKGNLTMTGVFEEVAKEAVQEAENQKIETAINILKEGLLSLEQVIKFFNFNNEQVKFILAQQKN